MGLYSRYDGAHNHPVNRALHMIAIPLGFSSVVVVWWHWVIGLLLIPAAFALAWLGHFIEGNKPAFLTNPVHVFVAPVWLARKVFGTGARRPPDRNSITDSQDAMPARGYFCSLSSSAHLLCHRP
jgi:hypothetical protein